MQHIVFLSTLLKRLCFHWNAQERQHGSMVLVKQSSLQVCTWTLMTLYTESQWKSNPGRSCYEAVGCITTDVLETFLFSVLISHPWRNPPSHTPCSENTRKEAFQNVAYPTGTTCSGEWNAALAHSKNVKMLFSLYLPKKSSKLGNAPLRLTPLSLQINFKLLQNWTEWLELLVRTKPNLQTSHLK